jgi:hypothetical protein
MNIKAIEKGSFTLIVDNIDDNVLVRMVTSEGNVNWYVLIDGDLISQWHNHDQLEEDYYDSL